MGEDHEHIPRINWHPSVRSLPELDEPAEVFRLPESFRHRVEVRRDLAELDVDVEDLEDYFEVVLDHVIDEYLEPEQNSQFAQKLKQQLALPNFLSFYAINDDEHELPYFQKHPSIVKKCEINELFSGISRTEEYEEPAGGKVIVPTKDMIDRKKLLVRMGADEELASGSAVYWSLAAGVSLLVADYVYDDIEAKLEPEAHLADYFTRIAAAVAALREGTKISAPDFRDFIVTAMSEGMAARLTGSWLDAHGMYDGQITPDYFDELSTVSFQQLLIENRSEDPSYEPRVALEDLAQAQPLNNDMVRRLFALLS